MNGQGISKNVSRPKLKVCGMREPENIMQVAALNPDYMGFIFYPASKRFADNLNEGILRNLPRTIKKTGVFVKAPFNEIIEKVKKYQLDAVQLHGNEPSELCGQIRLEGIEVIKAFGIDESFDFGMLNAYEETTDYFLFDTKTPAHGGSGKVFNWDLLKKSQSKKGYFLSGGLGIENIGTLSDFDAANLYALDLNSRFETVPGLKDINKLNIIFEHIKKLSAQAEKEKL